MKGFPKDVLKDLRLHLDTEQGHVATRIGELTAQDPFSNPDRLTDNAASDTEANEESSHDRFAAMVDEFKEKLADIAAAIERIDNGTYGFCISCGNLIDTDRLSILPTARLCLSCEKKRL
jgi:RNA polymerase-binding transcription factor DksA